MSVGAGTQHARRITEEGGLEEEGWAIGGASGSRYSCERVEGPGLTAGCALEGSSGLVAEGPRRVEVYSSPSGLTRVGAGG